MSFRNLRLNKKDLDFIYNSLEEVGLVRISKVGVFTLKRIKPRRFYHNFSDKQVVAAGRNKLHFRPFTKTKAKIQAYKNYHHV